MPTRPLVQTAAVTPAGINRAQPQLASPAIQAPAAPSPGVPVPTVSPQQGVVDQMLQQAYPTTPCGNAPCEGNGCVSGPARQFAEAACGACCDYPWYFENSLLWMTRNNGNRVYTSYETDNNPNQLMHTGMGIDWPIGGEIRFGHRFCCGLYAIEAVAWGLGDFTASDSVGLPPPGVSTPLAVDGIEFGGINGEDYFDGAAEHRLSRKSELYNAEVNFVRVAMGAGTHCCDNPLQVSCLAGLRFVRFTDQLVFGSLQQGGTWGGNGGLNEAYLNDRVTNDLYGFQVGLDGSYMIAPKWRLFCNTKVGIFDNHMQSKFQAYRGDGTVANPTEASEMTGSYPVRGSADALSFMTEIKCGLHWSFWNNWGAQIGYRVVAVTDVAFADAQIPFYVVDIPELMNVKHNGDLIAHGAFAGITWNF
jgi:hypothetical protein